VREGKEENFFFFWNPLEAWRKWEKNGPITKKKSYVPNDQITLQEK
jgi:hypothetical protein